MVAATQTYCPENGDNVQIALSEDALRLLFSRIEADLQHGQVYQRALTCLQTQHPLAQKVLRAVGREAIRLALRQIVRQHRVPPTSPPIPPEGSMIPDQQGKSSPDRLCRDAKAAAPDVMKLPPKPQAVKATVDLPNAMPPQPNHALRSRDAKARAAQAKLEQREAILRTIGAQLHQARVTQGYSLEQLHQLTWVPVYQLKFLEAGEVSRLPEDVYIQGFVRRVAETLNLDANAILAPLIQQAGDRVVVPSWQQPQAALRPIHLYVGYTALMTGALGSLIWLSYDANATHALDPDPVTHHHPSTTHAPSAPETNMTQRSVSIASPEMTPPETRF